MNERCSILTNHVHSQAPSVVCGGCYRLAMTSIQEGEDSIDRLERALDHERTARLEAEALAERLQADWDSNAHVGAQALADLRRVQEAALDLVTCATEAIRRADKAEERVAELEGLIAEHAATCDEACTGCGTAAMQRHKEPCPWRDAYLSHHARVTEPERLKAELRASVEAAERKRGERRG